MEFDTWTLDPNKFLSKEQAVRLLMFSRDRAERAFLKGKKVAVRDYFVIHLALMIGLRVMEIVALNCGDLSLNNNISSVMVLKGKGGKTRRVYFSGTFIKHCEEFLDWKRGIGESTESDQPLLLSSNSGTYMSRRATQRCFKRCARIAGLPLHYSIHCTRHTFACLLYEASNNNLRLVQKQLGHSKITTTQVYADVMSPAVRQALNGFNDILLVQNQ